MISAEMRGLIEIGKVRDLKLVMTKRCIECFRESKWHPELSNEFWKLAEVLAVIEWGKGTVVDDFSREDGKILIRNKEREMVL